MSTPLATPESISMPHILVVDDASELLALFTYLLKREGYQVESASDGFEALRLHQQFWSEGTPFSLIILDWSMPALSGLDVAHAIRRTDAAVALIFISAYHEVINQEKIAEVKAELWGKPIDIETFSTDLRRVLGQAEKTPPTHNE